MHLGSPVPLSRVLFVRWRELAQRLGIPEALANIEGSEQRALGERHHSLERQGKLEPVWHAVPPSHFLSSLLNELSSAQLMTSAARAAAGGLKGRDSAEGRGEKPSTGQAEPRCREASGS